MKFYLMHHLRIQPSEIEQWEFYEYQYTINNLVEHLKKEKDKHREEEEKSQEQYGGMQSQIRNAHSSGIKGADKYMKGMSGGASKAPSIPKIPSGGSGTSGLKLPSGGGLKTPSIKVPKM